MERVKNELSPSLVDASHSDCSRLSSGTRSNVDSVLYWHSILSRYLPPSIVCLPVPFNTTKSPHLRHDSLISTANAV